MVQETPKDALAFSEYDRTILGKSATRIELPICTADDGDALAPSDWKDILDFVRGWCAACEFEIQRDQSARDKAEQIIAEVRNLNRKLRAVRARAHKAAQDRREAFIKEKKEAMAKLVFRQAS